jgi:hypothetical protein
MGMQKVQSLKKLRYSPPNKGFIKPLRPEYELHVTQTHLRSLKDKHKVFTMFTCDFKRIQQSSDIPSSSM